MAMPFVYARDSPIPNQSGQQRSKSSGSFLGSEHIPSKASALIVTGIVKIQSISCQVPILFSTTDSWHEFDENISKDVLDNKYSSYSISYVCKGVDVLLTKSTWNIFLHCIKTQCPDQMVFINVTGSLSLLTGKLCGYNFLSSTASKTAKSSSALGSSSGVALEEDDTSKTQEEGERNEKLSTMPRSERESSMRKIVSELLKESKCEKCNTKHKHVLLDHAIEVDLSLEKKLKPTCSTTEMQNFFYKRNGFQYVFGNASLLLNPLYCQCPLCGSVISLGHFNEILTKNDKLINHVRLVHQNPLNSPLKGKYDSVTVI